MIYRCLFRNLTRCTFQRSLCLGRRTFLRTSSTCTHEIRTLRSVRRILCLLLNCVSIIVSRRLVTSTIRVLTGRTIIIRQTSRVFRRFLFLINRILRVRLLLRLIMRKYNISVCRFFMFNYILITMFIKTMVKRLIVLSSTFRYLIRLIFSLFLLQLYLMNVVEVDVAITVATVYAVFRQEVSVMTFTRRVI